jgi:hypothetical protein
VCQSTRIKARIKGDRDMTFKTVIKCDMPGCTQEADSMTSEIGWIQISHPDPLAQALAQIDVTMKKNDLSLVEEKRMRKVFHFCSSGHLASYIDNLTFEDTAGGIP